VKIPREGRAIKGIQGKVALVTGGGGGIGSAICERLAEEGADVAVVDQGGEKAEASAERVRATGAKAVAITADVADAADVERAFDVAQAELGRPAILVNCVAVSEGTDVYGTDAGQFARTLAVNVGSYFLTARELALRLREAGTPGVVVNVSSTNAFYAEPGAIAYTASKGAVDALTKGLALELAPAGIRVTAIAPGIIRTPITEWMLEHSEDGETMLKTWNDAHVLGRIGKPSEIAAVVAFLASDDASFVTGSTWLADGGLSSSWTF
jgi:NAD(P)-dependent dehydrogenase (short-subunit alcohol dehydrogenase family)